MLLVSEIDRQLAVLEQEPAQWDFKGGYSAEEAPRALQQMRSYSMQAYLAAQDGAERGGGGDGR
jgi:hypothetical protein